MIEPNDRVRFLLKPPQALPIASKAGWQEFERGFATSCQVGGQINFTHPTGADSCAEFVVADSLTHKRIRLSIFNDSRRNADSGGFNEIARSLVRSEEGFDFGAQRPITFAGHIQECADLVRFLIQRRMKDFLNRL